MKSLLPIVCLLFGLSLVSQEGVFENLSNKDGLKGEQFYAVYEDEKEGLFFSGNRGVYHYDGLFFSSVSDEIQITHFFQYNDSLYGINSFGEAFVFNNGGFEARIVSLEWKSQAGKIINQVISSEGSIHFGTVTPSLIASFSDI